MKPALKDAKGTNEKLKLLWSACGETDFLLERKIQLTSTLKLRGVNHEWRLTPGDHSWPGWRASLPSFLPASVLPLAMIRRASFLVACGMKARHSPPAFGAGCPGEPAVQHFDLVRIELAVPVLIQA